MLGTTRRMTNSYKQAKDLDTKEGKHDYMKTKDPDFSFFLLFLLILGLLLIPTMTTRLELGLVMELSSNATQGTSFVLGQSPYYRHDYQSLVINMASEFQKAPTLQSNFKQLRGPSENLIVDSNTVVPVNRSKEEIIKKSTTNVTSIRSAWNATWQVGTMSAVVHDIVLDARAATLVAVGCTWNVSIDEDGIVFLAGLSTANGSTKWMTKWALAGHTGSCPTAAVVDETRHVVYVAGTSIWVEPVDEHRWVTKAETGFVLARDTRTGDQLWVRTWDGENLVEFTDLAIDQYGYLYVSGTTNLLGNAILLKYSPSGDLMWERSWGTPHDWEFGETVDVDAQNNTYLGVTDFDEDCVSDPSATLVRVIKLDARGNVVWNATWDDPRSKNEEVRDLAVSPSGFVYVTGRSLTYSSIDVFVLKLDANSGIIQWELIWTPEGIATSREITIDGSTNYLYITGLHSDRDHGFRPFILKADNRGNISWSTFITVPTPPNETQSSAAQAILVDDEEQSLYVGGVAVMNRSTAGLAAVWKFWMTPDPYLPDLPPSSSSALNGRRTCLEGPASKNDASLEEGDYGYRFDDIRIYGVEETVLYFFGMLALVVVLVWIAIKLRRPPREVK